MNRMLRFILYSWREVLIFVFVFFIAWIVNFSSLNKDVFVGCMASICASILWSLKDKWEKHEKARQNIKTCIDNFITKYSVYSESNYNQLNDIKQDLRFLQNDVCNLSFDLYHRDDIFQLNSAICNEILNNENRRISNILKNIENQSIVFDNIFDTFLCKKNENSGNDENNTTQET